MNKLFAGFFLALFVLSSSALALGGGETHPQMEYRARTSEKLNEREKTKTIRPTDRLGAAIPYSFFL